MSVQPIRRPGLEGSWCGCVLRVEPGVVVVLTDRGEVRATLDGAMLAAVARDRTQLPQAGDWVRLRQWPDHHVTVLAAIRPEPRGLARVLPFLTN